MSNRLKWILTASLSSRRARLIAFWNYIVLRWETEICMVCGGRVGRATGSWWKASDGLWIEVMGDPHTVCCPRCFTKTAERKGIFVRWEALRDAD